MSSKRAEHVPMNVQQAYEHVMHDRVAPALRELGFTGKLRTFKYRRGAAEGTVEWQKDARAIRAQRLLFTANVTYWCGAGRIADLMPVPATDTWWNLTSGEPTDPVAESVVSALRRYALPAILAGLDDQERQPAPDMQWAGADASLFEPDEGGADPSASFVRPTGSPFDETFADFTSHMPNHRLQAAEHVALCAQSNPRAMPALLDRLERDPNPKVRKLIASRVLPLLAHDPQVRSALHVTAAGDADTGVRWAARYALRLTLEDG